ncbi:hypothetical protein AcW1_005158 [Taiwanofungus camphoratus]|nr:hypothetical protein AcW1_005158 [Antrodia cinnamomea]
MTWPPRNTPIHAAKDLPWPLSPSQRDEHRRNPNLGFIALSGTPSGGPRAFHNNRDRNDSPSRTGPDWPCFPRHTGTPYSIYHVVDRPHESTLTTVPSSLSSSRKIILP